MCRSHLQQQLLQLSAPVYYLKMTSVSITLVRQHTHWSFQRPFSASCHLILNLKSGLSLASSLSRPKHLISCLRQSRQNWVSSLS